jgi:hypothetical protein
MFEASNPCRADGACPASCDQARPLVDPDCVPNHCGADGTCALGCIDPPDPDCAASSCDAGASCAPTDVLTPGDAGAAPVPALPCGAFVVLGLALSGEGALQLRGRARRTARTRAAEKGVRG